MRGAWAIGLVLFGMLLGWWLTPTPAPPLAEPAPPVTRQPREVTTPVARPFSGDRVDAVIPDWVVERLELYAAELNDLRDRLQQLEQRPAGLANPQPAAAPRETGTNQERAGESRIKRLADAGLAPATAELIDSKLQEYELQRLYLRDRAVREDWFGTTRYTEAVDELQGGDADLRAMLDDNDYDLYLFATGQPNRLLVGSVMTGSAAEGAGLQANDVIYRYANERIFNTRELRERTAAGDVGVSVPVEVLRGTDLLLFYLPRGPIGVRLNLDRVSPR